MNEQQRKFMKPSILSARRFEKWVVAMPALSALFMSIDQVFQGDFWEAGIFFLTFALSGVIRQGFSHNSRRTASELADDFATVPQEACKTEMSEEEVDNLVTSAKRFAVLWTFTILAICIHLGVVWWKIAISIAALWILLVAVMGLLGATSKVR